MIEGKRQSFQVILNTIVLMHMLFHMQTALTHPQFHSKFQITTQLLEQNVTWSVPLDTGQSYIILEINHYQIKII